jgi:vacuolar-type H+-ATPase subunit H
MNEEIINQILELEKQAQTIHDDAQLKAAQIVEQAEIDADHLRQSAEKSRKEKVRQLLAKARESAKRERDRILDETRAEIEKIKAQAEINKQEAVQYVVDSVTWRE